MPNDPHTEDLVSRCVIALLPLMADPAVALTDEQAGDAIRRAIKLYIGIIEGLPERDGPDGDGG